MHIGADLTIKTVENIINGTLSPIPQDTTIKDGEALPDAPKIFKETCRIDWTQPAVRIHNLVRGLAPYPGAWTEISGITGGRTGKCENFRDPNITGRQSVRPGVISVEGDKMFISAGDSSLEVLSLQIPGKRRMTVAEFIRGYRPADNKLAICN